MAEIGGIPTGYERTLPPELQLLVRARRRVVAQRARGRVLDLGGADAHHQLWGQVAAVDEAVVLDGANDPELLALARSGARFDTVLSVFQLASANDLGATLRRVAALLADDGRLRFVEPGRLVGLPGRLQGLVAPPLGLLAGWRADRDVPAELRAAGLSVTDLERHRVPTFQWWVRMLVEGDAHHALPAAGPTTGASATS